MGGWWDFFVVRVDGGMAGGGMGRRGEVER